MDVNNVLSKMGINAEVFKNQVDSANRLWKLANGDTGQSGVAAKFLLGLFNGYNYPFNLTLLRTVDDAVFNDCIQVLKLDKYKIMEIHHHIGKTSKQFDELATQWRMLTDDDN